MPNGTGIRGETVDEILWLDQASDPTELGMTKLVNGDFKFYDQYGAFNPRSGGGITEAQHDALHQLIHFLDDGPGTGWASGTYKETLPAGSPFPTSEIWWTTAGKTQKILELTTTWNVNKTPATETWKMYDVAGVLLVTLVDTITYSGVFETSRTRTWS